MEQKFHFKLLMEVSDVRVLGYPVVVNPLMPAQIGVTVCPLQCWCVTGEHELHVAPATYTAMQVPRVWANMEWLVSQTRAIHGGLEH